MAENCQTETKSAGEFAHKFKDRIQMNLKPLKKSKSINYQDSTTAPKYGPNYQCKKQLRISNNF